MSQAYIAFGANLSNPRETLMQVVEACGAKGIIIDNVSSLWRSAAWPPGSDAPDYHNAVFVIRTDLSARNLMTFLLETETFLGRKRSVRNAPRTCDLDLIDFAGIISDDPHCILPHPRMTERDFVLLPLAEIVSPDWRHPVTGLSVIALLDNLKR